MEMAEINILIITMQFRTQLWKRTRLLGALEIFRFIIYSF